MRTILIVDDEEGFLHILQVVLQRAGFSTVTANNAHDAQKIVNHQPPDLIILDDMMPGMSGSELCIQLKNDPLYRQIPIIMHSAGLKIHDKSHVQRIGADGVLPKPSQPRDIVEAVKRFLGTYTA
ncbi:MAG: response regulator [Chloroflexota bacterium]|nr:response regulator [Chloroflexota bacterium]